MACPVRRHPWREKSHYTPVDVLRDGWAWGWEYLSYGLAWVVMGLVFGGLLAWLIYAFVLGWDRVGAQNTLEWIAIVLGLSGVIWFIASR